MRKKILLIGSSRIIQFKRFVNHLSEVKDENIDVEILDNSYAYPIKGQLFPESCFVVHHIEPNVINSFLLKIPYIRKFVTKREVCRKLDDLLSGSSYSLVNVHVVPFYSSDIVRIAHKKKVKTLLTPLGSDVLRVNKRGLKQLKIAFLETDYFNTNKEFSFADTICSLFEIPKDKLVNLCYSSDIFSAIVENKNKYTKEQLAKLLHIPYASYYICCGYNAQYQQQHKEMLYALTKIKYILPADYCIIIPLTYGSSRKAILSELRDIEQSNNLRIVFLTDYLSIEEVSYLRIITDLFIHIQTTDVANGSLSEFLLADTVCVNGGWLQYPHLEKYGIPYYKCDKIEELHSVIKDAITKGREGIRVDTRLLEGLKSFTWGKVISKWCDFYKSV